MHEKGMDITGLNMTEISEKLKKYMLGYFDGLSLDAGESLFSESHVFGFDEVSHLIPEKHYHLFQDTDWLNGACGFVGGDILMLLSDENYTRAYLLCIQKIDENGEIKKIILQDFLCS